MLAVFALLLSAGTALAAASNLSRTDHTEVRLISAATAAGDGRTVQLGLHFRMQPGWKVYWRSPGPGGFPPEIDWSGSENLANAQMEWPRPVRFSVLGFDTLGYEKEVVYPITATVTEPGAPLRLRAHIRYLTCSEICVPYETDLALDLPAGPAASSAFTHLIGRFGAQVPRSDAASGLSVERVSVDGPVTAPVLQVTARSRDGFSAPDIFIEGPELFEFGAPRITLSDDATVAVLTVDAGTPAQDPPPLVGQVMTFTLVDGGRAVESVMVPEPGARFDEPGAGALAVILGLALIGGLILNLMPCVLPVLSIKLLSVVSHGGGEPRQVRLRFLASAAGILVSFLVLAAAAIAIKAAGVAVGWGIQFQQPAFLVAIMLVLTVFAGNIWGLFEFRLPGAVADAGARGAAREGLTGDFLTGAFATLLATPCSAPFLGTAVGFALARGWFEIVLVFAALGLGLALPYLAVAAAPRLATSLPPPGPWMLRLKQVLAMALVATVIWLLTVLAAQAGLAAAVVVGGLMAVVLLLLWLRHRGKPRIPGAAVASGIGLVAVLAFVTPVLVPGSAPTNRADGVTAASAAWRAFDRSAIPMLVAQGKTVFVDVTADWCITCQANKTLVLNRGQVAARIGADGVVAMVADWTRPDPAISDYLASYGRYGIPFNVVYGPGAPAGLPLPELLTEDAVLAAFDKAAGPQPATARAQLPEEK